MKKLLMVLGSLLILAGFVACGEEIPTGADVYQIYTVNNSETKVEVHPCRLQSEDDDKLLKKLVECLSTPPEKLEYKVPFAMGFDILDLDLSDGMLSIDVSGSYLTMPATTEVLVRAAIVRTLTQVPSVRYVGITVDGQPLFDNAGDVVGLMTADMFIDNDGNEINTYEFVRVKLYFANMEGDKLIAVNREKYYSTNIPIERFVVEELIAGPGSAAEGVYPSINPEVKIISVTTRDGVCYLNLDSAFLTVVGNVPTEISIYSLVNSLAELSSVNKVQILINGEVPSSFSNATFERNLDYVTTLKNQNG